MFYKDVESVVSGRWVWMLAASKLITLTIARKVALENGYQHLTMCTMFFRLHLTRINPREIHVIKRCSIKAIKGNSSLLAQSLPTAVMHRLLFRLTSQTALGESHKNIRRGRAQALSAPLLPGFLCLNVCLRRCGMARFQRLRDCATSKQTRKRTMLTLSEKIDI